MADTGTTDSKPRIGVYVCHCGGNISDVIDVKRVAEEAGKLEGVTLSTDYIFMCSDPGQQKIKEAIRSGAVNRVVVAACSPRLHELTFRRALTQAGLNPFLLEQVNIREQGSWVHKMDHEGATDKAIKLTRAAVERVRLSKPLDMIEVKSLPSALVVGAGPAGMRAAIDMAARGSDVYLVEKTPFTGGNAARMDKLSPTEEDAKQVVGKLAAMIRDNPKIKLMTCAELTDSTGGIGKFTTSVRQVSRGVIAPMTEQELAKAVSACPVEVSDPFNAGLSKRRAIYRDYPGSFPDMPAIDWKACTKCGKCAEAVPGKIDLNMREETVTVETGVLVAATGYEHYTPAESEFGYGTVKDVVTLPQLIRMFDKNGPTKGEVLTSSGKRPKRIGFIHCVGSRELPEAKRPGPDRRLNAHCSRVCCTAVLQAANELKERDPSVDIISFYQDIRTYGRDAEVNYYDKASRNRVLFIRYNPRELPEVSALRGGITVRTKDLLTSGEEMEAEVDMLVLATGVSPASPGAIADKYKLPLSADRFLQEVHPKLRPVETAIGGIFLAGTCQAPMDTTEATAAAGAAAVKAASILEGGAVQLEPYVAKVDESKCKCHRDCVKACPAKGAIYINEEKQKAEVNPVLCISCGNCVNVCPERAIDLQGFEMAKFEKAVEQILKD